LGSRPAPDHHNHSLAPGPNFGVRLTWNASDQIDAAFSSAAGNVRSAVSKSLEAVACALLDRAVLKMNSDLESIFTVLSGTSQLAAEARIFRAKMDAANALVDSQRLMLAADPLTWLTQEIVIQL
jgi:hypothetical protein